jgi:hypothetical protein
MPDLRDVLLKAGLVDEKRVNEERSLATMRDEVPLAKLRKRHSDIERKLEVLAETTTVDDFRREARKVLRDNPVPALLQSVIQLVHKKELWKQEGGKLLRAHLFQFKSHFGPTSKSQWNEVMDRELPAQ